MHRFKPLQAATGQDFQGLQFVPNAASSHPCPTSFEPANLSFRTVGRNPKSIAPSAFSAELTAVSSPQRQLKGPGKTLATVAFLVIVVVSFVTDRVAIFSALSVDQLKDGVLLHSAIALIVLTVVFVAFAACASPKPTTPTPQACDALEAESKQRRLELASEIVRNGTNSLSYDPEAFVDRVQKVYKGLNNIVEEPELLSPY